MAGVSSYKDTARNLMVHEQFSASQEVQNAEEKRMSPIGFVLAAYMFGQVCFFGLGIVVAFA